MSQGSGVCCERSTCPPVLCVCVSKHLADSHLSPCAVSTLVFTLKSGGHVLCLTNAWTSVWLDSHQGSPSPQKLAHPTPRGQAVLWVSCCGLVLPVLQELHFAARPIPRKSKPCFIPTNVCHVALG